MKKGFRRSSIRTRLLIVPMLVILAAIAAMSVISGKAAEDALLKQMEIDSEMLTKQIIQRMDASQDYISSVNSNLDEKIKYATKAVSDMGTSVSNERLIKLSKDLGIFELNYFNKEGVIVYSNLAENIGWHPDSDHPLNAFFHSNEKELDEEIRKSAVSNDYVKYEAIKISGGGMIQTGVNANYIQELTEEFSTQNLINTLAEDGKIVYALFIDKNLTAVAHSDGTRVGLDLSNDEASISAVVNKKPHSSRFMYQDKIPTYDVIYPVEINGEHIGAIDIGFSMEDVNAAAASSSNTIRAFGVAMVAVLVLILFFASNYAIKIVNRLKSQMNEMAQGDFVLKESDKIKTANDEFGEIVKAVATMKTSVRTVLENVIDKSHSLASQAEEMTTTTRQSAIAADQVAKAVEDIARGSAVQASDTETGYTAVRLLSDIVGNNTSEINNLEESASTVNALKEEGLDLIENLVQNTVENAKSSAEVQKIIEETNANAGMIEVANERIKSIASQTNLLALNASIEAARAGEAGRGFSVVADEIRKLAEESNKFADEIGLIIAGLTAKTSMAVATMEQASRIVGEQEVSVKSTSQKFNGIADALNDMKRAMDIVSRSSEDMNEQNTKLNRIIENLSGISQESAANCEEVSASMEQQAAAINQISNSSDELANIAEDLNVLMAGFSI